MSDIASAYVQIIPSAKGIKGKITEELGGEAQSAGISVGTKIATALKGALAAAGIGKALSAILNEGGALEQSFGGLETIYGDASEQAKEFAKQAAIAGISANLYAEQAVSFGASLKQAFGGDTTKAVEAANTAILDMADNSAKMGTDINAIQTAYQGFAKQNYTMLDNLKLGYGGTKTEMERLLKDAQKISGVKYDIKNLGDVYDAIHVIQGELGLTGVAAYEASQTLQGSFNAMKASFKNFIGALAIGDDVAQPLTQFVKSTSDYLFNNLIPAVANVIKALPTAISTVITTAIPAFMEQGTQMINAMASGMGSFQNVINNLNLVFTRALNRIVQVLPQMQEKGYEIIQKIANGIFENAPTVIRFVGKILSDVIAKIMENMPNMLLKGVEMISQLASGLIQNLPAIINAMVSVLARIIATIGTRLPDFLARGADIIVAIGSGLINNAFQAVGKIPQIVGDIARNFMNYDWLSIGSNIIKGIASGIDSALSGLVGSAIEACKSLTAQVKSFFGISSPSKLMANEVGKYIPEGIAVGIEKNMGAVTSAMDELTGLTTGTMDFRASYGAMAEPYYGTGGFVQNITINSPQELSPSEIARQTRNATQQMALSLSGV